jgi:hypothetical protein
VRAAVAAVSADVRAPGLLAVDFFLAGAADRDVSPGRSSRGAAAASRPYLGLVDSRETKYSPVAGLSRRSLLQICDMSRSGHDC